MSHYQNILPAIGIYLPLLEHTSSYWNTSRYSNILPGLENACGGGGGNLIASPLPVDAAVVHNYFNN